MLDAAADNLFLIGFVTHIDLQFPSELDELTVKLCPRSRVQPGDETPLRLFACVSKRGGELRFPAAAHAHQNRASLRWISDQRLQMFMLVSLDITIACHHFRSTSKQDAVWRVSGTGHHVELGRERIELVVSNGMGVKIFGMRFAMLFVILQ